MMQPQNMFQMHCRAPLSWHAMIPSACRNQLLLYCIILCPQVISLGRKLDKERTGSVLIGDLLAALGILS